MTPLTKAYHLSLVLHLALAAALFLGQQWLAEETPPLVIDFSLALSEARAGEPDQPPGPPAAPAKTPAPQPKAVEKPVEPVSKPVTKPVTIVKKKPLPQKTKPKTKKVRKEPPPLVETSKDPASPAKAEPVAAEPSAKAESGGTSADAGANAGSRGNQTTATGGSAAKGGNRGQGNGMRYDFSYVRQRILRNLHFPAAARKMGLTGKIVVSFVLKANGQVDNITIVSSSGHGILDNTVVATIRRVAPFPKPPVSAQLLLPIVFHLK